MVGFVVRRLRGRLPLASAALLTVLITTAVLTALTVFDRAADEAGTRRALQGPGHGRTTVLLSGDRTLADRTADDAAVRGFAQDLFAPLPVTVQAVARSGSYGLAATAAPGKDPDLTTIAALDRARTVLADGSWPAAARPGGPVEVAVPEPALAGLGLAGARLPAELELTDRFTGRPLTVLATGVYRVADREDPYWRLDPLAGRGTQLLSFASYGPLLADDTVFTGGTVAQGARSWLVDADFTALPVAGTGALRQRAVDLADRIRREQSLRTDTDLPALLDELATDALVARSTLLVGALQLAVLAAAALLLVVHLLADRQAAENELLTARGASRRRIGAFTAAEAALLALPAAVLAPPLTPLLLRLLPGTGGALPTGVPAVSWPVAAAVAVGCVLLAVVPVLLRSAGTAVLRRAGRRRAAVAGAVRSGADLALLVLAVLAYQQLTHYAGGGLSADAAGRLGVDPLLVAAPTLALCAGTVLVLRLLPFAARLGERLAARGAGLAPALAGWQFARRPGRGAGPVLLLVLATSMGMLAVGQRASWSASQADQADFATAGGLRISGSAVPVAGQGGQYRALPGGDRLIPVIRKDQHLTDGRAATVLALDARAAAAHLPVRSDLLDGRDPKALFAALPAEPLTGAKAGPVLPGRPTRIDLDVTTRVTTPAHPLPDMDGFACPGVCRHDLRLRILLRDGLGVSYTVQAPPIAESGAQHVSVDLGGLYGAPTGTPAWPLTVAGLLVESELQPDSGVTGQLSIDRITALDGPGAAPAPVTLPEGLGWKVTAEAKGKLPSDGFGAKVGTGLLLLDYHTLSGPRGVQRMTVAPIDAEGAAAVAPEPVAVATRDYLAGSGASVGDEVRVPLGTATIKVKVVAQVQALPTAFGPAIALDLATLDRVLAAHGDYGLGPTEWWLPGTGPDDPTPRQAADRLRAGATVQNLQVRQELAADLRADPLGAAPQSALAALAVAAAALAAIGFAAASAGAAAERTAEFAVLVALGTPRRRLARTVAAEQGVLALLGLGVGLGLGALLVHLMVPLMVLTPTAHRPVPEVLVRLPLGQVALLAAAMAAVLLVSARPAARRHREPGSRLRHVEEM
ncbi:FtsX-like permease family protein [Kitasatospora terrestris]|uniref:ABC transporter permease n=1 Tax=Kitasatospora terrestris TaxID=258051 RepID=A0ABP9DIQ2_9ACTN